MSASAALTTVPPPSADELAPALALSLALLAATAAPARAVGNPDTLVVRLPFTPEVCQALIARGAPFQLGGPDTDEACIIIIGGRTG
jgi:hypothetical protein